MNIFLSYTHQDSSIAKEVIQSLELAEHIVWDHRREIKLGDSIMHKVNEAIENSDVAIFLMSKKSTATQNWPYEWTQAVSSQNRGKLSQIIPVLLEKDVPIPFFLQDVRYLDASDPKTRMPRIKSLISALHASRLKQKRRLDYDSQTQRLKIEQSEMQLQQVFFEHERDIRNWRVNAVMMGLILSLTISIVIFTMIKVAGNSLYQLGWLIGLAAGYTSALAAAYFLSKERLKSYQKEIERLVEERNKLTEKLFKGYTAPR